MCKSEKVSATSATGHKKGQGADGDRAEWRSSKWSVNVHGRQPKIVGHGGVTSMIGDSPTLARSWQGSEGCHK